MSAETGLQPPPAWATSIHQADVQGLTPARDAGPAIDRVLIAERIYRYGWSYDERDRAALGDCFTEDGVWEGRIMGRDEVGPFEGRAAILDFLTAFWDEQADQRRHIFTNVVVDGLGGTQASAHSYLLLTASSDASMTPVTAGPYRFDMVKDSDDVWRIRRLTGGWDAPF
jgi:hypothetical protein